MTTEYTLEYWLFTLMITRLTGELWLTATAQHHERALGTTCCKKDSFYWMNITFAPS